MEALAQQTAEEKLAQRTLQQNDETRCRRLGIDVNNLKFRRDYFGFRDAFEVIIGSGYIGSDIVLILHERWRRGEYKAEASADGKAKRGPGRPRKTVEA